VSTKAPKTKQKDSRSVANLFTVEVGMNRDGNLVMDMSYVDRETFIRLMEKHHPSYEKASDLMNFVDYCRGLFQEAHDKAGKYFR